MSNTEIISALSGILFIIFGVAMNFQKIKGVFKPTNTNTKIEIKKDDSEHDEKHKKIDSDMREISNNMLLQGQLLTQIQDRLDKGDDHFEKLTNSVNNIDKSLAVLAERTKKE